MSTYFISDLHLDSSRPDILEQFIQFNAEIIASASAYYILGDFFEYWIGDDDPAIGLQAALESLKTVSSSGVPTYLMHGNRDFLIGQTFAEKHNITLISDPSVIDLYGTATLLMHGDLLCTEDTAYQAFRKQVRDPKWQEDFLSKPIEERLKIVDSYREISKRETSGKTEDIMDVDANAVKKIMQEHQISRLIHGHTHRPNIHKFSINGKPASRIVLGDWYRTMTYLKVDANRVELV